ncbi:MAG: hypothetical protein ACK5Y2_11110 [Bdellovibrionales bacterium]
MKSVLVVLFASVTAMASTQTLNCVVPLEGKAPVITATLEVSEESQGDFLVLTVTEPGRTLSYYNQMEKGAYQEGISQGQLVSLVISETAKMENGAVRGAGLLVIAKGPEGLEGFATLNDTFYPLTCK